MKDQGLQELKRDFLATIPGFDNHDAVYGAPFYDGGKAVAVLYIAIHNTKYGNALGGLRFSSYSSQHEAIQDALGLSKSMSYKAAIAGLPCGGGKAVLYELKKGFVKKNPEKVFPWVGRMVESLGGQYVTAEDVSIGMEELKLIAKETDYVRGLSQDGKDKTSQMTAYGVIEGIKVCLKFAYGSEDFSKHSFLIQGGAGKVGRWVVQHLFAQNAGKIVISEKQNKQDTSRILRIISIAGDAYSYIPAEKQLSGRRKPISVFVPCALGSCIDPGTIYHLLLLDCRVVAGCTNNPLASPEDGLLLHEAGITYAPDVVINVGGLINVVYEDQLLAEKEKHVKEIGNRVWDILCESRATGKAPSQIAEARARKLLGLA